MDWRMRSFFVIVIVTCSVILLLFTVLAPSQQIPTHMNLTVIDWIPNSELGLDFIASYHVESKWSPYKIRQHKTPYLKIKTPQSYNNKCSKRIELPSYEIEPGGSEGEIFFLETSGRSWLTPREACALESASKFSQLRVNILFMSRGLPRLIDPSSLFPWFIPI